MGKPERDHMARVVALDCCACRAEGIEFSPAGIHHIREGQGAGQRASDYETIPLCPPHHQHADGTANFLGHVAFHRFPDRFQKRYGTELFFLEQTLRLLGRDDLILKHVTLR